MFCGIPRTSRLEPEPGLGDHAIAEVNADRAAARADSPGHVGRVRAVTAADVEHRLPWPQLQLADRHRLAAVDARQGLGGLQVAD
jgi:hypothetical protein